MTINYNRTILIEILLISMFGILQLYVLTSGFTLLQDPYYYVYHSAANSILKGSLGELSKMFFDNFASSPGTPILLSISAIILGSDIDNLLMYLGLFLGYVVLYLVNLIIYQKLNNSKELALLILGGTGFFALFTPTYTYDIDSYLMLLTLIMLLLRRDAKISDLIIAILLSISINLKYAPLGLYITIIILSFLIIFIIFRKLRSTYVILSLSISMTSLSYFLYMGFFFNKDFQSYFVMIIKALRMETLYTRTYARVQGITRDLVLGVLTSISSLRFTLFFLLLLYLILLISYKKFRLILPSENTALGTAGVFLYIVGVILFVFVGWLSDYGFRILRLSYVFYLATVCSLVYSMKKIKQQDRSIKLSFLKKRVIFAIIALSFLGNIFVPISDIYYRWAFLDLSSHYRFRLEAFLISEIIYRSLSSVAQYGIAYTYRYTYIASLYNLPNINIQDFSLQSILDYKGLIILPRLISEIPDSRFGPLPEVFLNKLIMQKNIIVNSGLTWVFL